MSENEHQAGEPAHFHHHGRTKAAWAGSIIAGIGFILGSIAFLLGPNWVLFWISMALLLTAVVTTDVLRRMGHGQVA